MTFGQFPYNLKFWQFLALLIGFIAIIFILTGFISNAFASTPFSDDFEAYNAGDLSGQGDWEHLDSSGTYNVVGTEVHSGTKSVQAVDGRIDRLGSFSTSGEWSFWIYKSGTQSFELLLLGDWTTWDIGCGEIFFDAHTVGKISLYDMTGGFPITDVADMVYNEWFKLTINFDFSTFQYRIKINDGEYTAYKAIYNSCSGAGFQGIRLRTGTSATVYIDDIGDAGLPPEPEVWVDTPATSSEITDLSDEITLEWSGLTDYDDLYLTFKHYGTGIITGAKRYSISEIGASGSMQIPLTDFNFTKNGNWYLNAIASYEGYLIEGGMFLSGYGSQFTDDLTGGSYYLAINIEGFDPVFSMTDFGSWYDSNVDRFDEPTGAFDAMADFLSPIFSYIGEFGNRIEDYFNDSDAYAKGYDVGKAFPVFTYYVGQIAYFLGGFPLLTTFLVIILLMVGIFIFKLVIRFIPHFGS